MANNSWQTPIDAEPGGGQWHKFEDPGTGWFASKTAGWTADQFTPGGFEVDFGSIKREGMKAVRVLVVIFSPASAFSVLFYRPSGDLDISNTPAASSEYSHAIARAEVNGLTNYRQVVMWLSSDYKIQLAVSADTGADVFVAYPIEYML